tara:strand:- start:41 stop:211 length:171 start_codon:yes stop_codon:yes gene_type:complete
MAITKEQIQDKIEVVGDFRKIQVRTATVIKEDGKEAQFHTDAVKKAYADHIAKQDI